MAKPKKEKGLGTDVHAVMAWLFVLLVLGRDPGPIPVEVSLVVSYYRGGSPNMKLLFALCLWVSDPSNPVHRKRLLVFLRREKTCFGQSEPTSSSHMQLWLGAMGTILYLAERRHDQEFFELAAWWLSVHYAINAVCESNGDMWCAGGRGFGGKGKDRRPVGSNQTASETWAAITSGKSPKILTNGGLPNRSHLGAILVARGSEEARARIRQRPEPMPPMAGALHARRFEDGDFFAFYESLDRVYDPVLSAGVLGGKRWISAVIDHEKIAEYGGRTPVLEIDAPRGVIAGRADKDNFKEA